MGGRIWESGRSIRCREYGKDTDYGGNGCNFEVRFNERFNSCKSKANIVV